MIRYSFSLLLRLILISLATALAGCPGCHAQTATATGPITLGGFSYPGQQAQPGEQASLANTLYCNPPFIVDPALYPSGVYFISFQAACKPDVNYPLAASMTMALYSWANSSTMVLMAYTEQDGGMEMWWGTEALLVTGSSWITYSYPFTSQTVITASFTQNYSLCFIPGQDETIYIYNDSYTNMASQTPVNANVNANNNGFPALFTPSNRTNVPSRQIWMNVCAVNNGTCSAPYQKPTPAGPIVLGDYWQAGNIVEAVYLSSIPNTLYCGSPFTVSPSLYPAGVYLQSLQVSSRPNTNYPLWSYMQMAMYEWSSDNSSATLMVYSEPDAAVSMQYGAGDPLVAGTGWLNYVIPFSPLSLLAASNQVFYSVCFVPDEAETIYSFNDSSLSLSSVLLNLNTNAYASTNGLPIVLVPSNRSGVASRQTWANFCHANQSSCHPAYILPTSTGPLVLGDYWQPGNVVEPVYQGAVPSTLYCNSPFTVFSSAYPTGVFLNSFEISCRPNTNKPLTFYLGMALYRWTSASVGSLWAYTGNDASGWWGSSDPLFIADGNIVYINSTLPGWLPADNTTQWSVCFIPRNLETVYTFNNSLSSAASSTNTISANNSGFPSLYIPANSSGVPDKQIWVNVNSVQAYQLCILMQGTDFESQLSAVVLTNATAPGPGVCHPVLSATGTRTFTNGSSGVSNTSNVLSVPGLNTFVGNDNCLFFDAYPAISSAGLAFNLDNTPIQDGVSGNPPTSNNVVYSYDSVQYRERTVPCCGGLTPMETSPVYSSVTWSPSSAAALPSCPAPIASNFTFCLILVSPQYTVTFSGWMGTTGPFLTIPANSNNRLPSTQQGLRVTSAGGTLIYRDTSTTGFATTLEIMSLMNLNTVDNNDNFLFPNNGMALTWYGIAFELSGVLPIIGYQTTSMLLNIYYDPQTAQYRMENSDRQIAPVPASSSFGIQPSLGDSNQNTCVVPGSPSSSCPALLGSSVFVLGASVDLFITDECQFTNLSIAEAVLLQPVCRFAPTTVIIPGFLVTSENGTQEVVVSCALPPILPPGQYVVQLSLDGSTAFQPVFVDPPIIINQPSIHKSLSSPMTSVTISLNHSYNNDTDLLPMGWNQGDVMELYWSSFCTQSVAFLDLLLYVTFFETVPMVTGSVVYQVLDVIALNLNCTTSGSITWTVRNITDQLASLAVSPQQLVSLTLVPAIAPSAVAVATDGSGQGRRRLLVSGSDVAYAGLVAAAGVAGVGAAVLGIAALPAEATVIAGIAAYVALGGNIANFAGAAGQFANAYNDWSHSSSHSGSGGEGNNGNGGNGDTSGTNGGNNGNGGNGACSGLAVITPGGHTNCYTFPLNPPPNHNGDIHTLTMDGLHYDFQALGTFWSLQDYQPTYQSLAGGGRGCSMQVQLQPFDYELDPSSAEAMSYRGATFTAAVGIQADSECGPVVLRARSSLSNVTNSWIDVYDNGFLVLVPYIAFSVQDASQFAQPYSLTCSSIIVTSASTAILTTYNGYSISLTTYGVAAARFSNVIVSPPAAAFNSTRGLLGSWDGNSTNDLVDQYGHDWMSDYPTSVDAAAFLFGETWAVAANDSFFVSPEPANLTCLTTYSAGEMVQGCLFGTVGVTNMVANTNFTQIQAQFSPQAVPVVPSSWPNQTLYAAALQACVTATGSTNLSTTLNRDGLYDIFFTNDTSVVLAQQVAAWQSSVSSVSLSFNVTASNDTVSVLVDLSSIAVISGGSPCSSLLLTTTANSIGVNSNLISCIILLNVQGAGIMPASQYLSTAVLNATSSSTKLGLLLTNLTQATRYIVSIGLLVYPGNNSPPVLSPRSSASAVTLGCYPSCVLSILDPCGSDGCGGSCGQCSAPSSCTVTGLAVNASANIVINRTDGGPFGCAAVTASFSTSSSLSSLSSPGDTGSTSSRTSALSSAMSFHSSSSASTAASGTSAMFSSPSVTAGSTTTSSSARASSSVISSSSFNAASSSVTSPVSSTAVSFSPASSSSLNLLSPTSPSSTSGTGITAITGTSTSSSAQSTRAATSNVPSSTGTAPSSSSSSTFGAGLSGSSVGLAQTAATGTSKPSVESPITANDANAAYSSSLSLLLGLMIVQVAIIIGTVTVFLA